MNVIAIVEMDGSNVLSLNVYKDDTPANTQFKACVQENCDDLLTERQLEDLVDSGSYERGEYQVQYLYGKLHD